MISMVIGLCRSLANELNARAIACILAADQHNPSGVWFNEIKQNRTACALPLQRGITTGWATLPRRNDRAVVRPRTETPAEAVIDPRSFSVRAVPSAAEPECGSSASSSAAAETWSPGDEPPAVPWPSLTPCFQQLSTRHDSDYFPGSSAGSATSSNAYAGQSSFKYSGSATSVCTQSRSANSNFPACRFSAV
jgi:hypothetical protein